jgi:mono/diheme cytochrome c family protein
MIKQIFKLVLWAVLPTIMLTGCYYDTEEELYPDSVNATCDTSNVRYSVEVKAVFDARCNSCHAGVNASANIRLDNYADIKAYIDATGGKLVSSILQDGNASAMPQGQPKISDCEINKVSIWVNNSYPEN